MERKKYILIGLIVVILIITGYFIYQNFSESQLGHNPSDDKCQVDSDCVCTLKCPDCCGKVGQSWKCINDRCELGFYSK